MALLFDNPIVLGAVIAALVGAGVAARVGATMRRALLLGVPLALTIALINALVSRDGLHVIVRLGDLPVLGHTDITLEATVYGLDPRAARGGAAALRRALHRRGRPRRDARCCSGACRSARRSRRRSRRGWCRCCCATRGGWPTPSAAGRGRRRARATLLRAASAGVFDRALDVAAALEVRGYGVARRAPGRRRRPWSRHDLAFAAAAALSARAPSRGRVAGVATIRAYPALHIAAGPGDARRLAIAVLLVAWLPFADRRGVREVTVLEIDRLTYRYPAGVPALRDVSLTVEPGEIVVVAGRLGSGKSTLLRAASGLVPHFFGGEISGR